MYRLPTSKAVQLCEAPSRSSSQQPRVACLLSIFSSLSTPLFLYLTTTFISSMREVAPASRSTITSPNPPPSVCISAVLIAPETQSNRHEMFAGVQLTGSPVLPLFSCSLFHICPRAQALCSLSCAHSDPVLCLVPPHSFRIRASCVPRRLRKPPSSWTLPSPHAAPADPMWRRRSAATPTCCSRFTSTSTAWRRAAREEVSTIRLLDLELRNTVPTS